DGLGHSAARPPHRITVAAVVIGFCALLPLHDRLFPAALALLIGGGAVALVARSRLGGQTGDVLGAIKLVSEVSGLLALAAWM
ncbi:MAG: adenosylcobinamide-GDP ribazoletransferase, partial [Hyphomicrobiaceae bacterium]